jgi:transposase-like protein
LELISSLSASEKELLEKRLADPIPPDTPNTETVVGPPEKPSCPDCKSELVKGHGKYRGRSRYKCLACGRTFNDLTKTPLAGLHAENHDKMRQFAAHMADGGDPLRKNARDFDVNLRTAFNWRHKVLQGYSVAPTRTLKGIAEADETFFLYSEKGDRRVAKRRRPRKRGGKAAKAGINDEQVPVIVGCDREGELILGVAGRGRISLKQIERVLGNRIDSEATLCTDSHSSFRKFAKTHHLKIKPANTSKGKRVVKDIYHIQHVNSAHTRLKTWIARFNGVSTKRLDNYAQWYGLLEETKSLANQSEEFIDRSVPHRMRD